MLPKGSSVTRVQHPTHGLLVDAERCGERNAGQTAFPEGDGESGLHGHARRHGHAVLTGLSAARRGDRLPVFDTSGQRLLECVGRFGKRFASVCARCQALGQVAERHHHFVRRGGGELGWVDQIHALVLRRLTEVARLEPELTDHGGHRHQRQP